MEFRNTKFTRVKNHNYSVKTKNGITLERRLLPESLKVRKMISGLYEIEGYDYATTSKVNKRMRDNTYTGKYMDLKNAFR